MEDAPQTWHYGLGARWWAEFNDDFRPHEIPYFRRLVERGEPASTSAADRPAPASVSPGRAGRRRLRRLGGHDRALPRKGRARRALTESLRPGDARARAARPYRTIYVCGSFSLGSDREQDVEALNRFYDYLEPEGTLVIDIEVPYADARQWGHWLQEARGSLPEAAKPPRERRRASDGSELALRSRIVELDPLAQRVTLEMHAELWQGRNIAG